MIKKILIADETKTPNKETMKDPQFYAGDQLFKTKDHARMYKRSHRVEMGRVVIQRVGLESATNDEIKELLIKTSELM